MPREIPSGIKARVVAAWLNNSTEAKNSPKAAKFCALGALYRASNIKMTPAWDKPHVAKDAQNYLKKAIGEADIVAWNNRKRSSESVIQGFDRAIKLAKSEGK